MKDTSARIDNFQKRLLLWYNLNQRNFPWRKKSISNYQKVIVEVLLQRTKAATVSNMYQGFMNRFPNWKSISTSSLDQLEDALRPIGLYKQRAKRLHGLAVEMTKKNGRLPRGYNDLLKIPMIGQYIANSIMSVIFNKPYPMLDVNMARVLERYFGERKKADIRYDSYLQELSFKVVDMDESKYMNWAILDYAALVCKAQSPQCTTCSLSNGCNYYKSL